MQRSRNITQIELPFQTYVRARSTSEHWRQHGIAKMNEGESAKE